ncbi:MAG: choline dehydrogenase [Pseudomonadota bacterium]
MAYDYIIVGAGSAGCVLANRLSANPDVRVLLLEAGGRDSNFWIKVPAGYVKTMDNPAVNWLFQTTPDPKTGNRAIPVPRGRTLGGSSSINGMIYVRGQALDYDTWAQLGNRGWSYQDVLPYFKKSQHREEASTDYHGVDGPLNVRELDERHPLMDALIDAGEAIGVPRNPDYNGATQEGFGYFQVTHKNGQRHSAADAYLHPISGRANLQIETHAQVERIDFDGRRATGVTYRQHGKTHAELAGREVILAAGAIQSPQLLELSGVGDATRLSELGIPVVHHLPGVGENLQDHYIVRVVWQINQPFTLNEQLRGPSLVREVAKYMFGRRGALTLTPGVVYGFVKSRPELAGPDIQYHTAHASFANPAKRVLDRVPGLTIGPCQLRPESRGSVHATTSNPFAAPAIAPNFLDALVDQQTQIAGVRIARSLGATAALGRYITEERVPGSGCDTDDEILDFVRSTGATVYHPVGTCKMGSDPMAVVDDQLRVHGIAGLRVVDASIMPTLTSGNTNAPAIMIGEKGADLILDAPAR